MILKGGAKSDVSYGFWVGLGLLLAFAAWHLASYLMNRARGDG